jgi:hypothetical protein
VNGRLPDLLLGDGAAFRCGAVAAVTAARPTSTGGRPTMAKKSKKDKKKDKKGKKK